MQLYAATMRASGESKHDQILLLPNRSNTLSRDTDKLVPSIAPRLVCSPWGNEHSRTNKKQAIMDIGIVYHIENAHQFWSGACQLGRVLLSTSHMVVSSIELDDMLRIPHPATLSLLDGTLLRFVEFCAAHHGISAWHFQSYS